MTRYNEFLELYMEKTGLKYEVADVLAKRLNKFEKTKN
jgi:hypothetical protein